MKYIIRADDLGYSEGINYGIYKSASDGMIRNIGLMANMPAAEHGIQLLQRLEKEYGRKICLGLHVNISNGRPLSDPVEIPGLTETDGSFHNSRYYRNSGQDLVLLFVLHPGYLDQYILNTSSLTVNRTKEVEMACAAETKHWLYENGITCCTFSDFYGTDSEKIRK